MFASPAYRYRAALRRARRYRRGGGRLAGWQKAAIALTTLAALGATGADLHHHHGHGGILVSGNLSTRPGWARSFLASIPEPVTPCNMSAVVAWETREGGGFGNQAANDPLNVNPPPGTPWPGYHAIGAWAFPDPGTGLAYTVQTITNGDYGNILAALNAGNNAQAVCDAIMASPWASSHYNGTLTASC